MTVLPTVTKSLAVDEVAVDVCPPVVRDVPEELKSVVYSDEEATNTGSVVGNVVVMCGHALDSASSEMQDME